MRALAVAGCLLAGCASLKPISEAEVRSRTAVLDQGPAFFFATAKATYFDAERRLKGELGLVVAKPDRLYVEVRGPGGTPVSTFVCAEGKAQLYDLEGPAFYEGEATAAALARILPVGLPPAQAVDLLSGRLPVPATLSKREAKGGTVIVEGIAENLGLVRLSGGGDRWKLELLERGIILSFSKRHPTGIFQRLEIVDKPAGREVLFRLVDLELAGDPPPLEIFQLGLPDGLKAQSL